MSNNESYRPMKLTEAETLYALRCLDKVDGGTVEQLGLSKRALDSLCTQELVVTILPPVGPPLYRLTWQGEKWLMDNGGPFSYG